MHTSKTELVSSEAACLGGQVPIEKKTTMPCGSCPPEWEVPRCISIRWLPNADYIFLPAAGYRNDTSLNNAGSNGNYWSRTLNTNNPNNARNLNFNSSNINTNNNNRYNGQSVRPVRLSTYRFTERGVHPSSFTI